LCFKKVSRIALGCQHKFVAPRPKTVRMSVAFRQNTTKNVADRSIKQQQQWKNY